MSKTAVSACIVAYHGYEEVAKAASSVLCCTKEVDLTLYLVDNASTDGTGQALAKHGFDARTQVICLPKNVGFGSGHNTVLPKLNSKYHFVINPDIVIDSDVLSQMCAWMDAHPDVVMATPRLVFPDGQEQYTPKRTPNFIGLLSRQLPLPCLAKAERHYLMQDEDLTVPQDIDFCTGCFFVMRTEAFCAMGGFDETYFMYVEDADITRKAKAFGRVMYVPDMVVCHAWHRDTRRKWKNFWMQIRSMLHYWAKWGFALRS